MLTTLDPRELSRLKWRCRRGLLENDLFIERFFAHHEATITPEQARGLHALMELSDNDLLDLLLARKEPEGELERAEVVQVLHLLRAAPIRRPPQSPSLQRAREEQAGDMFARSAVRPETSRTPYDSV
jgi:antitoxin CptB